MANNNMGPTNDDLLRIIQQKDAEISSLKTELIAMRQSIDKLSDQLAQYAKMGIRTGGPPQSPIPDSDTDTNCTPKPTKPTKAKRSSDQSSCSTGATKKQKSTTAHEVTSIHNVSIESIPTDGDVTMRSNNEMAVDINDADDVYDGDDVNVDDGTWQFVNFKNKKLNRSKIPPIQVDLSKGGFSALHATLIRSIGKNHFTINARGDGTGARIYPADMEQHSHILKTLENHAYSFHTYLTADQKKKCFIIRGLTSELGYSDTEIYDELVRAGFPASAFVREHLTGHMRANGGHTLFKIVVPSNFDENIFHQIRSIFGIGIKFERFLSKDVTQCTKCQRYFHTSTACYRQPRCVKCTSNHETRHCEKPTEAEPQCVNCNGYHTANNHVKCEYFQQHILPIINKRASNNNSNQNRSSIINQNRNKNSNVGLSRRNNVDALNGSYSSHFKNNSAPRRNPPAEPSGAQTLERMMGMMLRFMENQDKMMARMFNNGNQ